MAKNKARFFHAHRAIFVDLLRPAVTRQYARALWHQMFKAKEGVGDFPEPARRAYNVASRLLTAQLREAQPTEEAA
jgi:hypothetical protein